MKLLREKIYVGLLAGILYSAGLYFSRPSLHETCFQKSAEGTCITSVAQGLGHTLQISGIIFGVVSVIIIFANRRGWVRWLHFSRIFVVLSLLFLVFWTPTSLLTTYLYTDRAAFDLGAFLYIPATILIVTLTYLPFRVRNRQSECETDQKKN